MTLAFPARFGDRRDTYQEARRERLLLDCEALLSDEAERYAGPLAELEKQLVRLLLPQSLNPQSSANAALAIERAHADGVAELERAGHGGSLSVYQFVHRLMALEKAPKS